MSGVLALKDIALSSPVTFCLTSLVKEDQMTAQDPLNLIWIDLEMTGLDPERERIIEIATVVTDANLNVLAEGPSLVVHQQDTLLDAMDNWPGSPFSGALHARAGCFFPLSQSGCQYFKRAGKTLEA